MKDYDTDSANPRTDRNGYAQVREVIFIRELAKWTILLAVGSHVTTPFS